MVKILFVNGDPTTRDIMKVALQQFEGFEGHFAEARDFLNHLGEARYHVVFVEDMPNPNETRELLEILDQDQMRLPVVVIAEEINIKSFIHDKKRLNISTFLRKPLDPVEVFRLLNRLREKAGAMDLSTN
jgi:DNA-binding NtrC family response regulator